MFILKAAGHTLLFDQQAIAAIAAVPIVVAMACCVSRVSDNGPRQ